MTNGLTIHLDLVSRLSRASYLSHILIVTLVIINIILVSVRLVSYQQDEVEDIQNKKEEM